MSSLNRNRRKLRQLIQQTHTPLPHWQKPTITGWPVIKTNRHKWCFMIAAWAVVIGVALGAGLNRGRCTIPQTWRHGMPQPSCSSSDSLLSPDTISDSVRILRKVADSMPSSFRNVRRNEITDVEYLKPIAEILAKEKRPLRILHIGDSHVAGKIFPSTLKATLIQYLGEAESAGKGEGVWYNYIAKNGATNQTLITDEYMHKFEQKHPDLIILSLGTNEAHGMGYKEEQHRRDLTRFLEKLKSGCPDAVILITTPPGDYISYSYVNYHKTSRSNQKVRQVRRGKKPNPMSARCAAFLVQFGHEKQIPVWDLFSICGGAESAQRNWVTGHYMRPDRIHFLPVGYTVQGKLLGESLVQGLAQFRF